MGYGWDRISKVMMGEWRYTEILGWNIEYQDGGVKAMNDDEGQIEVKQAT